MNYIKAMKAQTSSFSPRKIANNLNAVIHSKNLYNGTARFIDARVEKGVVTVENLYTGERVPFTGQGWRNGYGNHVSVTSGD